MFFNDDILYRNGAFAIVWLAGNEVLLRKNKRNKDFQLALKSNLVTICHDLRGLFPQMGTAYGIPLIKMGILAKGAGAIYCLKMSNFANDIKRAMICLRKPALSASALINMPPPQSKSKAKAQKVVDPVCEDVGGQPAANETAFGLLPDGMEEIEGAVEFGTPRALPSARDSLELSQPIPPFRMDVSPIRRRRRSRDETAAASKRHKDDDSEELIYQDVLRKLRSSTADPRSHCMLEDNVPLPTQEPDLDFGGDFGEFGDGMAILLASEGAMPQQVRDVPVEEITAGEVLPAPSSISSAVGPPSNLEMNSRSKEGMVTPPRSETHPENYRGRRGERMDDNEERLELGEIVDDRVTRRRDSNRARKRLRLAIDEQTNMTLKEMLERNKAMNDRMNSANLLEESRKERAPPKSLWRMIPKTASAMDFIKTCGRPCPSILLNEMRNEIMRHQLERPEKSDLSSGTDQVSAEQQRDRTEQTTNMASTLPSVPGQTTLMPEMELGPINMEPEPICAEIEQPQLEFAEPLGPAPAMEGLEPDGFPGSGDDNASVVPFQQPGFDDDGVKTRSQRARKSKIGEKTGLENLENENVFSDLYPPGEVTRRRASMAFFTLLKMQARKQVHLHQEKPFAKIDIERLASLEVQQ